VKAVALGVHNPALTYFSGICGTKFSKKEVFFKKPRISGLRAGYGAAGRSVTAAFSPIRRLASPHLFAD
jgi:hypothetical protein